jgi:tetratricopeptide (TPR) repeat protein
MTSRRFTSTVTTLMWTTLLAASVNAGQTGVHSQQQMLLLSEAYAKLRQRQFEEAIPLFLRAVEGPPRTANAPVRKDLAYTYLKIGEPELAREQFRLVMELAPADHHAALEYAFLCFETKQRREARLVFDRIRREGDATARATAEQAFANVDGELAAGIARWQKALEQTPDRFSVHQELAELAEHRNELALAAKHFAEAWRLRPDMRQFLVDLGRVRRLRQDEDAALPALLAASRSPEPRVAERARALLPARYPFVYEFEAALQLDPANTALRRELGFLHLAMDRRDRAETEFAEVCRRDQNDLLAAAQYGFLLLARGEVDQATPWLERVLKSGDPALLERVQKALKVTRKTELTAVDLDARLMAERSYQAGFLQDALRFYRLAQERNPHDEQLLLRIGWTLNMLKRDQEAMDWFGRARKSPDAKVAAEAEKAYRNLRPQYAPVRTTAWMFPFYSSRWSNVLSYGQVKAEFRLGSLPVRPYLSTRFVGDTSRLSRAGVVVPGTLSEEAAIAAVGLGTRSYHGLMAWGEAGSAISLFGRRMRPDYRAGVSFAKGFGQHMGAERGGWFFTTNDDAVFVSRFENNTLIYGQNRVGYTWTRRLQTLWNMNCTMDVRRLWWGNFCETGPGLRLGVGAIVFSVDLVRGRHLVNEGNPRGALFTDLRAGFWYAITR